MESYCKILIVEDEFLLRQGIKNLVHWEQEGFQVVGETNNGKEALQLIESLHPQSAAILCNRRGWRGNRRGCSP